MEETKAFTELHTKIEMANKSKYEKKKLFTIDNLY